MTEIPAEQVVLGFLLDVRSGRRLERAGRYLARRVLAHQGSPGAERGVVVRTPEGYAAHVREMLAAAGSWTFVVTGLTAHDGLVEATWQQTAPEQVEHGRAWYRVRAGRVDEYWIDALRTAVRRTSSGRKSSASGLQGAGGALFPRRTGADLGSRR